MIAQSVHQAEMLVLKAFIDDISARVRSNCPQTYGTISIHFQSMYWFGRQSLKVQVV